MAVKLFRNGGNGHDNLRGVMTPNGPASGDGQRRLLQFRRSGQLPRPPAMSPQPESDLGRYERGDEDDNYRHRMTMNAAALVLVVGLIAAGLWLADTMARMRKNQDCVLSGRSGCTPVKVTPDRW